MPPAVSVSHIVATFSASLAPPRVTGMVEEAAAEHAHTVRQGRVMEFFTLLRVLGVVVMDELARVDFLRSDLLEFA